jgi:hypothetical protein
MSLNPLSSFRKGATALSTAAVLGASMLASFSAAAQERSATAAPSEQVTVNTNCRDWKPGEFMADTECEIRKGGALDTQAKLIAAQNACITELVKFKKAEPAEFSRLAFGTITRENACSLASRIPKRAASLQQ